MLELTGTKIGRLTVLRKVGRDSRGNVLWLCQCECGNLTTRRAFSLKNGSVRSCGCLIAEHARELAKLGLCLIDLTGRKFGKLTVVSRDLSYRESAIRKNPRWFCQCECGAEISVVGQILTEGRKTCCGCSGQREQHRETYTPEYRAWLSMKTRGTNPNVYYAKNYFGRGIRVCDEWLKSYTAFIRYVGRKPSPKHSLDRYPNNDGNYEPGNVRWATAQEQQANKRRSAA